MYNLLNIYDCPKCGKRLSDEVEYINVQLSDDEWGKIPFCSKCNSEVKIRMHIDPETKQEIYHYEEVDEERARWANGFYDSMINDFEDDDDSYSYKCSTCGGEIANDYSTCTCGEDEPEDRQNKDMHIIITDEDDLPF